MILTFNRRKRVASDEHERAINGELYRRFLAFEHGAKDVDSAISKAHQIEEA